MERDDFQRLFRFNAYCEMAHVNKKGYPIVTPMFYVIHDGFLQMSSIQKYRHKVHHLVENPKISVSIHNDGCNVRHQKAILMIGQAEVYTDDATMREIHWAIIDKYWYELKEMEQRAGRIHGGAHAAALHHQGAPGEGHDLGLRQDGRGLRPRRLVRRVLTSSRCASNEPPL